MENFEIHSLSCSYDLQKLVGIASNRKRWKELSNDVYKAAQAEKFILDLDAIVL